MTGARGATADEWFQLDFVLGLGANLLPCVPAGDDVKVAKGSALEGKVGKIPSMFNRAGEAHGLKEWQKREIMSAEVQQWSADRRLNVCVRTGPISGVYAFDVDVDDAETAHEVQMYIMSPISTNSVRTRANSAKFLIPFKLDCDIPCKKRIIKTAHGRIELLADGQQFVAAGSHSSGVRYQWSPDLPTTIPTLTLAQVNQMWSELTSRFAMSPSTTKTAALATSDQELNLFKSEITSPLISGTPTAVNSTENTSQLRTEITDSDWSKLIDALRTLFEVAGDNDKWSEIGYSLLSLQKTRPARQLFIEFSRKAKGYTEGAPEQWWQAHVGQETRTDYRHIFTLARAQGWGRSSDPNIFAPIRQSVPGGEVGSGKDDAVRSDSDDGEIDVAPAPLPTKPVVRLVDHEFSNIIRQLEEIIEPHIYTQGPSLVRPTEAHTIKEIRRSTDAIMLCEATKSWAKMKYGDLCTFQRWAKTKEGGTWYEVKPDGEHINTMLELGSWTILRPLDAVARAPFIRADGSICDTAGYDRRSRVLYVPGAIYPGIPAVPDKSDAGRALGRLRGIFHQFPWKEPASESAFLSHILTEAARLAVDRCPMFFYTAPSAGTGKGLLSEMASTIVHGTVPALRAWVSDGDELRKVLFAALLAGDRSLLFDNVPTGFKTRAPELCGFITADNYNGRKLGESESHTVPNRAVLSATGNNITPVGDMARRSIVVRLDANTERLKQRVFEIENLRGHVMANRPALLVDALTIIKAFQVAKDVPEMPVMLPSFERWSRTVRDPLIWLGMPDPCDTQNETDDETNSLAAVFMALATHFGDREFTCNDVARVAGGLLDADGELISAMQQCGCSEPASPVKVGYWLRGERDKISEGWKLVRTKGTNKAMRYKFERVEESLT
jgi:hypothetical protein